MNPSCDCDPSMSGGTMDMLPAQSMTICCTCTGLAARRDTPAARARAVAAAALEDASAIALFMMLKLLELLEMMDLHKFVYAKNASAEFLNRPL